MKPRKTDESLHLRTTTTKSYILALSLVAILSISAYVIMHKVITSQNDRAAVINVSGRQRMLSQRIGLYSEYLASGKASEAIENRNKLRGLLEKFLDNHQRLMSGEADLGDTVTEVRQIYFGSNDHLDVDMKLFDQAVTALIKTDLNNAEVVEQRVSKIRALQEQILPKLDLVVQANQRDNELQISRLRTLDTTILLFTLSLLLIEAFFIFRPMVKSIARLFNAAVEARETAIKATNEKSTFLATVTHEIRTPMTGVLGITESLLDSEEDNIRRDQLNVLRTLSENLITMVNNILDYSKIEAGKMTLEKIDFSIEGVAKDTQNLFESSAMRKLISLTSTVDPGIPVASLGDPTRLRQVVTNFVGNALKFTPQGGRIEVSYKALDLDEKNFVLRIEVKDTGPGIFKSSQAKLFSNYSQADQTVARKYGGTGLGLSICKQIADTMGGKVGVESEEGKGATFWFEAKLERGHGAYNLVSVKTHTPANGWASGLRVLVVEDNEVTMKIVKGQLTKMGFGVEEAVNGVEGLNLAADNAYDFVLMDCEMPEMDGFEACSRLRDIELKTGAQPVPVFAMTAHAAEDVRDRCFEAGMNSIVTKPIRYEALSSLLYERLSHKVSRSA